MKYIPDIPEIEEVSKACDILVNYMRRHSEPEIIDAISTVCQFVSRVKKNIDWLENLVEVLRGKDTSQS